MKINSTKLIKVLLLASLALTACGKKNLTDDVSAASVAVDPVEASIESGLTMISGMSDDQAGSSYAQMSSLQKPSIWQMILGDQAMADNCARAYFQACHNGLKIANYEACIVAGTNRSITGQVQLSYSHMSCTLASTGDQVTRTYDLDISGPRGGVLAHQSAVSVDYRGTSYGGGGRITKSASGWDLEVLGRHSQLSFRDREIFNVSVRTLAPLQISGTLSRAGRVISSGQLEVNHNVSKFTSVITPSNLTWSNACCHPTSGSLNVVYSGAKSGSATVTFQGCGSATVDQGGQQQQIELSYCD
jgi:hypothetical protein